MPLRIEVGPRDVEARQARFVRRDSNEKEDVPMACLTQKVALLLVTMQHDLLSKARKSRDDNIVKFQWVLTKDNLSDISTKLLDIQTFERLRGELMVRKAIPAVPRAAAPGNLVQALKRRRKIGPTQRLRLRGQLEM